MSKKPEEDIEQLPHLSDRDRDIFIATLEHPERPMPDAIRKARARKEELVVSDSKDADV